MRSIRRRLTARCETPRVSLTDFIAGLPKAELHVHHVGSASPRIVAELAERHPAAGVPADPDELREFFAFRDFAHFIEVYLAVVDLVRTPEDVRMLTYEVAREMAVEQRLRYAELTCTPYTSVVRGIPIEAYTEAIEDARVAAERDFGLVLRWIYDIPGESGIPAAEATLAYALDHAPDALVGFGLGGPEIGVPRPQFQPHFDAARAAGLRSVPHAGETTGPETVWDAVRLLGAERIGHGTSSAADPALLRAPRGGRHRAGGLPDVQHRHPRRRDPRRAPAADVRRGRRARSRSTPTTRRCSARRSTTSTPSRPTCWASTSPASPTSRARPCGRRSPRRTSRTRILGEIDAYAG